MNRVLVLFSSHHGQTRAIAFRIAELLRARGQHVHLRHITDEDPDPSHFDAVVVGASVHFSKHDRRVGDWLARHALALAMRPGAFFSVSMSAASQRPDVLSKLDAMVVDFLSESGWRPVRLVKFAGALRYTRYNFFIRLMMRLISGSQGRPTDTRRDHEFTDWAQVDAFARDLLNLLPQAASAAATTASHARSSKPPSAMSSGAAGGS
jgi:menaquinone-dependent protoporphyrinogen oxidase